jgi:hypothetical protein
MHLLYTKNVEKSGEQQNTIQKKKLTKIFFLKVASRMPIYATRPHDGMNEFNADPGRLQSYICNAPPPASDTNVAAAPSPPSTDAVQGFVFLFFGLKETVWQHFAKHLLFPYAQNPENDAMVTD